MNHIFSFIICTNNEMYFAECISYIKRLQVPEDWQVELIQIKDAKSMTAGYNEGMKAASGTIKIYIHQDVFILYPGFLFSIKEIFESNAQIGLIGMVGAQELSKDGVMWHVPEIGNLYGMDGDGLELVSEKNVYSQYVYSIEEGYSRVKTVDGLMMVTSKDITWREDIFDGWDFYDVSQSLEMQRAGYEVVVPTQEYPWVLHDDGILNLKNYDKYRKICMNEYFEFWKEL